MDGTEVDLDIMVPDIMEIDQVPGTTADTEASLVHMGILVTVKIMDMVARGIREVQGHKLAQVLNHITQTLAYPV